MTRYVLSRVLAIVLIFFCVTFLMFLAVYALPGDPIRNLSGAQNFSPATVQALRETYGLNDPVLSQYLAYMGRLFHGDLGTDFNGASVSTLMAERWPVTAKLALTAWAFEIVIGLGLGIGAGLRKGRSVDKGIMALTIVVLSLPVFVLGYVLQLLLGIKMGWLPISGAEDGWPTSYLMPAVVLGAGGAVTTGRLVRSSVIKTLNADFVRTARAKGLGPMRVFRRHILRNSLIPVVTFLGVDLGFIFAGTVIVEGIFNLPGVGNLLFSSIQLQQGTVVVGVATAIIFVFLLSTLVVDLIYPFLDPRIVKK